MNFTKHKIIFKSSTNLDNIKDGSIQLVVTSPPYPMIEMWDEVFFKQNQKIKDALECSDSSLVFELMHQELDKTWAEVYRVLIDGGIVCINIGDATRTVNENFQLFNNHTRIISTCLKLGLQTLPAIIWRKQTNAPNKFMGSGMLPPGAYVTLEHEYILILRKKKKRLFEDESEKNIRRESAFFWEERNVWFSDVWMDLKGAGQKLKQKELRNRSGAYPFELAYRLINMFSVKGDTILDPFVGTGTTTIAAIASERNSIGAEIDKNFSTLIKERILNSKSGLNDYVQHRVKKHLNFVKEREMIKGKLKYLNKSHGFPVMTLQERVMKVRLVDKIEQFKKNEYKSTYTEDLAKEKEEAQLQICFENESNP